jgi:cation/acetate symporter
MVIATWIQMIKAALLVLGCALFCIGILARFDFSLADMLRVAVDVHPRHALIMQPGGSYFADPMSGISLTLALSLGLLGMPHVLMRFFTAPNAHEARRGAFWGTVIVAAFYAMLALIGYGAIAILTTDPAVIAGGGMPPGGQNMVVMALTRVVGGDAFFGFMAAVVLATILAVVAGLAISSAATLSHDLARALFPHLVATDRRELIASRIGAVGISALSLVFALSLQNQNIAILGTLALGTAASANFPVLLLALYWPGLTSRGAAWGMAVGLGLSIGLIGASPMVMVDMLGFEQAWVRLSNPTLIAMGAAFLVAYVVSTLDTSPDATRSRAAFLAAQRPKEAV